MFITTANYLHGDPAAAAGPHGDHPAPRLHRVGEGRDRRAVPDPEAEARTTASPTSTSTFAEDADPRRHPPLHEGGRRPQPRARDRHGLPQDRARTSSPRSAGRHRRKPRRSKITPKRLPRYLGAAHVPRRRGRRRTTRSASPTAWPSRCTAATCWRPRSRSSPGKGKLMLTGKLGDVMQESAQAAMSYVRSRAPSLGLDRDFYSQRRHPRALPRGRDPQGRPVGGHHHGTGAGLGAAAHPGAARRGDDRRDHAARARAADRRAQGEDPRRAPRRASRP